MSPTSSTLPVDPFQVYVDGVYDAEKPEEPRGYLGASAVGHSCDAVLAMILRGLPEKPVGGRIKRIFKMGHTIEKMVVDDLRKSGYVVQEVDPATGKQYEWTLMNGHVEGHADGLISVPSKPEKNLLEIKSMNDKMFKLFRTRGVAISHPKYLSQVMMMMGMAGLNRSMLVSYNKNTSEYAVEFIDFDPILYADLLDRIERVSELKVRRIQIRENGFPCVMCSRKDYCWQPQANVPPVLTCKNCKNSVPSKLKHKAWHCTLKNVEATGVCSSHEFWTPEPK